MYSWSSSSSNLKVSNVVQREETVVNRLRRATNHGKFSRAAWELDVVLNSRLWKIPKQKIIQIYHITSIFTKFWAFVRGRPFNSWGGGGGDFWSSIIFFLAIWWAGYFFPSKCSAGYFFPSSLLWRIFFPSEKGHVFTYTKCIYIHIVVIAVIVLI